MSLDPRVANALCYALIGGGALSVASAVVNAFTAWQLIEPADEQSLGITRPELLRWCATLLVAGGAMIALGWRGLRLRSTED